VFECPLDDVASVAQHRSDPTGEILGLVQPLLGSIVFVVDVAGVGFVTDHA